MKVIGKNLELQGKIGVSIYAETYALCNRAYAVTTINGDEIESEIEQTYNGLIVTVFVKPKELHDEITMRFYGSGTPIPLITGEEELTFSVADIAKQYQNKVFDKETQELAEAIVNYGSYAQKMLKYNTSSAQVTDTLGDVTKADVADYKTVTSGKVTGLTYQGNGLTLNADTVLGVYFKVSRGYDLADYSFTLDGKKIEPVDAGSGFCYLEIEGIKAKDLGKNYSIVVKKGSSKFEVKTSVLSWAEQVLGGNGSDTATVNMAKMVYRYSEKANAYFAANE